MSDLVVSLSVTADGKLAVRELSSVDAAQKNLAKTTRDSGTSNDDAKKKLEQYLAKLKEEVDLIGKSAAQQSLYRAAKLGANEEQLKSVAAANKSIQAQERGIAMMSALRTAAIGAAAALGTALVASYAAATHAAAEAEMASSKVIAILNATGYAAGLTKKDIAELADELARTSLFDDEQIKNAASKMLLFKNVQGDTFREGMKLAVDYAAIFGDVESAVLVVGKALNNPSEGMTQLNRQLQISNPAFEALLKNLEETGRRGEAQALILKELKERFGGASQTINTGYNKAMADAKKATQEFFESLGNTSIVKGTFTQFLDNTAQSMERWKGMIEGTHSSWKVLLGTLYKFTPGGGGASYNLLEESKLPTPPKAPDPDRPKADKGAASQQDVQKLKDLRDANTKLEEINKRYISSQERLKKELLDYTEVATQAGKTEAEIAAGRARIIDFYGEKQRVGIEKSIKAAEQEAQAKKAAADYIFDIEKKALEEEQALAEYYRKVGLTSEQEYLKAKADIRARAAEAATTKALAELSAEEKTLESLRNQKPRDNKEAADLDLKVVEQKQKVEQASRKVTLALQDEARTNREANREMVELSERQKREFEAIAQAANEYVKNLDDQSSEIEFQISLIGKTEAEQRRLTEARRIDVELQRLAVEYGKQIAAATQAGDTEKAARLAQAHQQQAEALERQRDNMPTLVTLYAQLQEEAQRWVDVMQSAAEWGFKAFEAAISGGKKSSEVMRELGRTIKSEVIRALYEMTAKKWIVQGVAALAGGPSTSAGQAVLSAGAQGGGLLGQLFGGGSLLTGGLNSIGNFASSIGLQSVGNFFGGATGALQGPTLTGAALGGQAASAGSGIMSSLSAAGPYMAAAMAVYSIYEALKKKGGPKEGGSFIGNYNGAGALTGTGSERLYTPSTQDAQAKTLGEGVAATFFATLKSLGGSVTGASFGIGFDADPKGTADSRIKNNVSINGQQVYNVNDKGVGRDPESLKAALDDEAARAVLAALKASNLAPQIAKVFDSIDVSTASKAAIDSALATANAVRVALDEIGKISSGANDFQKMLESIVKGVDTSIVSQLAAMKEQIEATRTATNAAINSGDISAAVAGYQQLYSLQKQYVSSQISAVQTLIGRVQSLEQSAYQFSMSIGAKLNALGVSRDLTGLSRGRADQIWSGLNNRVSLDDKMSGVQEYVGAIDDWLAGMQADAQRMAEQQASAAQAAMESQKAANDAQMKALEAQKQGYEQIVQLAERAKGMREGLQLSGANPMSVYGRLDMATDFVKAAETAYNNATTAKKGEAGSKYLDALNARLQILQSGQAFDRPSAEYLSLYNDTIARITEVEGGATDAAQHLADLTNQIAQLQAQGNSIASASYDVQSATASYMQQANAEAAAAYQKAEEEYKRLNEEARAAAEAELAAVTGGQDVQLFIAENAHAQSELQRAMLDALIAIANNTSGGTGGGPNINVQVAPPSGGSGIGGNGGSSGVSPEQVIELFNGAIKGYVKDNRTYIKQQITYA